MTKQENLINEMQKGTATGTQVSDLIFKLSENKYPLKTELLKIATEFYKNNPSKGIRDLKHEEETKRRSSFLRVGQLI